MLIKSFDVAKMDHKFLNKAEKITSFNLDTNDFISVNPARKNEIRYLFLRHFYPSLKDNIFISGNTITKAGFNSAASKLITANRAMYQKMHSYKAGLSGIGPGEVSIFFVYDNAYLGGGSSKGVDVKLGPSEYEVKAIDIDSQNRAFKFFTGSAIDTSEYIAEMLNVAKSINAEGSMQGIPLKAIRDRAPDRYKMIEQKYAQFIYKEYFKGHEIIFIDNKKNVIAGVKEVKPADIGIESITQSRIKPRVQL